MKKILACIPLTVVLLTTAAVSCRKSELPSAPGNPTPPTSPQAMITGGEGLMYLGTPQSTGRDIECFQPCGMCHVIRKADDYWPDVNNPNNNEAVTDFSVTAEGHLLLSANVAGVGNNYVNEIIASESFNVAMETVLPQSLVDEACDRAHVPHWGGPVSIAARHYHVTTGAEANHLLMEGSYTPDAGWNWTFSMQ